MQMNKCTSHLIKYRLNFCSLLIVIVISIFTTQKSKAADASYFPETQVKGALEPLGKGFKDCGFCYRDPRTEPPMLRWSAGSAQEAGIPAGWILFDITEQKDCRNLCLEKSFSVLGGKGYSRRWAPSSEANGLESVLPNEQFSNCVNGCYSVRRKGVVWGRRFDKNVNAILIPQITREQDCKIPPPVKLTVEVMGDGLGKVSITDSGFFDNHEETGEKLKVCMKSGEPQVACETPVSIAAVASKGSSFDWKPLNSGRHFVAAPLEDSYFKGWKISGVTGDLLKAIAKKCKPTSDPNCDLSGLNIPRGTKLSAEFKKAIKLTVELENGGSVSNDGTYPVGTGQKSPAVFEPSAPGKPNICQDSVCKIVVTNQLGERNRYFSATARGKWGGKFLGWSLVDADEKPLDLITNSYGYPVSTTCRNSPDAFNSCSLVGIDIKPGWKLKAKWIYTPEGSIALKIRHERPGYMNNDMAKISLPDGFNNGQTWVADDLNRKYKDPIFDGNTNYSHSGLKQLQIVRNLDFISERLNLTASPVTGCAVPVFDHWEVVNRIDSNGKNLGPDIRGGCSTSPICNLMPLAQVKSSEEYPKSITAVFRMLQETCPPTSSPTQPAQPQCRITGTFNTITKNVELLSNTTGSYSSGSATQEGNARVLITQNIKKEHQVVQQTSEIYLVFRLYTPQNPNQAQCQTTVTVPALPTSTPPSTIPVSIPGGTNDPSCRWTPSNSANACMGGFKFIVCGGVSGCIKETCTCAGINP